MQNQHQRHNSWPCTRTDPVTFTDDGTLDTHEVRFDTMLEGTDLTPEERQTVVQFLQLNADVFCWEPSQLGCCTIGCHTIDTGDAPPVRQSYYKMPYKKHEQMRQHVRQLLDLGIIRPSNSPWASPAHSGTQEGRRYKTGHQLSKGQQLEPQGRLPLAKNLMIC